MGVCGQLALYLIQFGQQEKGLMDTIDSIAEAILNGERLSIQIQGVEPEELARANGWFVQFSSGCGTGQCIHCSYITSRRGERLEITIDPTVPLDKRTLLAGQLQSIGARFPNSVTRR